MTVDSEQSITPTPKERVTNISKIGPWDLGEIIGKGSSGTVRIASHTSTGQKAAVKIMSTEAIINSRKSIVAEAEDTDRLLQSIEREIVIMKLIEHPNVLSLLDVWEAKGLLFVVMEYIDGGELFDYLVERGRLPVPEALHYFQQIMYAVAYCHQFCIAHRDLKPENILFDGDKNIKVADFGMAMFVPRDSLLHTSCGSPHYASPEVVSGQPYKGNVSDIWSCGVILYALLAGCLPFDDEDIRGLLDKVREGKYLIPADIPWPAQNLIRRMMEKDVERRITVSEVLKHPFFCSVPPHSPPVLAPIFADLASVIPIGFENSSIDVDIMKNMRTLWRNRQDKDIIRAIRSKQDNWEKIAYHLLYLFRMKRLECIGPNEISYRSQHRLRHKSKQRVSRVQPANTSGNPDSPGTAYSRILERPSAPTPTRARSQTAAVDRPIVDEASVSVTAPLTPRKRAKTAPTSSGSGVPEIVIQKATPGRKGIQNSLNSLQDYEEIYGEAPTQLDPRSFVGDDRPTQVMPFVPISGLTVGEEVFFQEITEMLVTMSKRDKVEGKKLSDNSRLSRGQELEIPTSELPTPPTTPTTPLFEVGGFDPPPRLVAQNIRLDPPPGVLTPLNVDNSTQHAKDCVAQQGHLSKIRAIPPEVVAADVPCAKENASAVVSGSIAHPRGRTRTRTIGTTPSQFQEREHSRDKQTTKKRAQVAKNLIGLEQTRKRSQSVGRDEPRLSDKWFSNLFHFKPNRQELFSVHDVFSTRERFIGSLRTLGVQVETGELLPHSYGGSTLRCRMDEAVDPSGTLTANKALRFRVEIRPTTGVQYAAGYLSELVLVQEKGQPGIFSALCSRLRRGWELDVTCQADGSFDVLNATNDGGLPSPALTGEGACADA